jgi:hypothetical protein
MKNKVDISKLIEKKYKGNTLDLSDILEQIDLVLKENITNYEYRREGEPGYLEENPESVNISQRMYGAQGIRNEIPDEPGYGDNVDITPSVRPTTVAEAEDAKGSKKTKSVTVTVPDLFSLISNQNMELDSPERLMINDIISNFKQGNWIDKTKELQNFINNPLQIEGGAKDMGMRKAISSLMYISVLKKISFFIAQPGKLFEYIIAPLIGADAKVVGSTDSDIIDITRENGYGYSVKFFTGKTSSFQVKGSYENLQKVIAKDPTKAITYIIAASNVEQKTLELVELNISSNKDYFNSYTAVTEYSGATLFRNSTNPGIFGLYILSEEGKNNKKRDAELAAAARSQAAAAEKSQKAAEKSQKAAQPKLEPQDSVNFDNKQFTVEELEKINKQLRNQFSTIPKNIFQKELQTRLEKPYSAIFPGDLKDKLRRFDNLEQLKSFINQYSADINNSLEAAEQQKIARGAQTQQPVQQDQLEESLDEVGGKVEAQIPQTQPDTEELGRQVAKYEFNIPLKGQWTNFTKIELKFAEVKTYNQFALELSNSIQISMANALNAFSSLGTNLTKYLGTARSEEGQDKNYAQRCIDDTVVIEENILNIASEEGDKILKKK